MAKYYAYIPREDGIEPVGTGNRCLFECKGRSHHASRMAFNRLGTHNFVLIRYTCLYSDSTFTVIKGKHIKN
jgi:hypothetical protein